MLAIGETLVSEEVLEKHFVCDLTACKGACCVKGDYGAPLDDDELPVLDRIYPAVKPYLSKDGVKTLERQGLYVRYSRSEWVTPLISGRECAYTVFEKGVAKCGIEKAWRDGAIEFRKPVSCHLYPIRIQRMKNGVEAVNYDRWSICKAACKLGDTLKVPVFRFLEEALVRRFGKRWFSRLERAAKELETRER
jgi:hypothetical protein